MGSSLHFPEPQVSPCPTRAPIPQHWASTTACTLLLPCTNQLAQLPLGTVPSQSISPHPCWTTPHALIRPTFILQANVGKTSACHSLFPSLHAGSQFLSLWRSTWLHSSGCCCLSLVFLGLPMAACAICQDLSLLPYKSLTPHGLRLSRPLMEQWWSPLPHRLIESLLVFQHHLQ